MMTKEEMKAQINEAFKQYGIDQLSAAELAAKIKEYTNSENGPKPEEKAHVIHLIKGLKPRVSQPNWLTTISEFELQDIAKSNLVKSLPLLVRFHQEVKSVYENKLASLDPSLGQDQQIALVKVQKDAYEASQQLLEKLKQYQEGLANDTDLDDKFYDDLQADLEVVKNLAQSKHTLEIGVIAEQFEVMDVDKNEDEEVKKEKEEGDNNNNNNNNDNNKKDYHQELIHALQKEFAIDKNLSWKSAVYHDGKVQQRTAKQKNITLPIANRDIKNEIDTNQRFVQSPQNTPVISNISGDISSSNNTINAGYVQSTHANYSEGNAVALSTSASELNNVEDADTRAKLSQHSATMAKSLVKLADSYTSADALYKDIDKVFAQATEQAKAKSQLTDEEIEKHKPSSTLTHSFDNGKVYITVTATNNSDSVVFGFNPNDKGIYPMCGGFTDTNNIIATLPENTFIFSLSAQAWQYLPQGIEQLRAKLLTVKATPPLQQPTAREYSAALEQWVTDGVEAKRQDLEESIHIVNAAIKDYPFDDLHPRSKYTLGNLLHWLHDDDESRDVPPPPNVLTHEDAKRAINNLREHFKATGKASQDVTKNYNDINLDTFINDLDKVSIGGDVSITTQWLEPMHLHRLRMFVDNQSSPNSQELLMKACDGLGYAESNALFKHLIKEGHYQNEPTLLKDAIDRVRVEILSRQMGHIEDTINGEKNAIRDKVIKGIKSNAGLKTFFFSILTAPLTVISVGISSYLYYKHVKNKHIKKYDETFKLASKEEIKEKLDAANLHKDNSLTYITTTLKEATEVKTFRRQLFNESGGARKSPKDVNNVDINHDYKNSDALINSSDQLKTTKVVSAEGDNPEVRLVMTNNQANRWTLYREAVKQTHTRGRMDNSNDYFGSLSGDDRNVLWKRSQETRDEGKEATLGYENQHDNLQSMNRDARPSN